MIHAVYPLNVPLAANGNGTGKVIKDHAFGVVNFSGGGAGWTAQLQGKVTGGDWANVGTPATQAAVANVVVPDGLTDLRVVVSGWTGGQPVAIYAGFNQRGE